MKKTIVLVVILALGVAAGCYMLFHGREATLVKTTKVETGAITSTLSATGKVVSKQEAEISSPLPGQVQAVYVEEGERVTAGGLLALLDDRELRADAKAAAESVLEAEAKVRQLKRDYDSLSAVYRVGGVSRQSVEDAKSALVMARAAASRALAELNRKQIAIDKLQIKAPFAGVVTRKGLNPGEWASQGVAVFSLAKESPREIEVMVDESDAGVVKVAQSVELTSDAFPGRVWVEQVMEVAPAVKREGTANSVKVRVSCGTETPDLKLGQQVDAKIRLAHRDAIVKVPFDCIISTAGKRCVAKAKDGTVRLTPVVTGIEDAVSVEILEGAAAGEAVIVPEGKPVKEGERVRTVAREPSRP